MSNDELSLIFNKLKRVSGEHGPRAIRNKSKVMIIERANNNRIETENTAGYEIVDSFIY